MFSNQILKIYTLRIIGMLFSILSYLIVIPKISGNLVQYGLYSVVMSLMLLLQYADLGFLGAGQKYAAEKYIKNEQKEEIEILSFVHFILFLVVLFYAISLIIIYHSPSLLFNKLDVNEMILAKKLLLIFILSSPIIIFQRYISSIFIIRLQDYIYQSVEIFSNLFKIISTYFFFSDSEYNLVGYILFVQIVNSIAILVNLSIIKYRFNYNFKLVISKFRFNNKIYQLTKKMAITSIVITFSWILYYELDTIYVSKFFEIRIVSFFAIGTTILSFSRTLINIFLSPFQVKFNQINGLGHDLEQDVFFEKVIQWSAPISILPTLCIIYLMEPLIINWIGVNYKESIFISKVLISNLFFSFLAIPISYIAMSKEKYKFLFISSITLPIFYFLITFFLIKYISFYALPIAKTSTIFLSLLINLFMIRDVYNNSIIKLLYKIFKHLIFPILLLYILLHVFSPFIHFSNEKNLHNIFIIILIGGISVISTIILYYSSNNYTRNYFFIKFKTFVNNFNVKKKYEVNS